MPTSQHTLASDAWYSMSTRDPKNKVCALTLTHHVLTSWCVAVWDSTAARKRATTRGNTAEGAT